jgi:hypothetical protein
MTWPFKRARYYRLWAHCNNCDDLQRFKVPNGITWTGYKSCCPGCGCLGRLYKRVLVIVVNGILHEIEDAPQFMVNVIDAQLVKDIESCEPTQT